MEFAYTPEQCDVRARAAALAQELMRHEHACEMEGGLSPAVQAEVATRVAAAGLAASNSSRP
jgi:acyl-CoA dehydrogenase